MKVRLRFTKLGKIRWTSHRDVARMWERAFRRESLPLAYSVGFSPRPKVSFGLALPTGHESLAEYLDIELSDGPGEGSGGQATWPLDVEALPRRLSSALPDGVDAIEAAVIPAGTPSLQEDVTSCSWRIAIVAADGFDPPTVESITHRVEALLAAPEAIITRSRKGVAVTEDVRPGVLAVTVVGFDGGDSWPGVVVEADLGTQPRGLRPSELIAALGDDLAEGHVRRLNQWISRDGARREPLGVGPAAATGAPHAMVRAS